MTRLQVACNCVCVCVLDRGRVRRRRCLLLGERERRRERKTRERGGFDSILSFWHRHRHRDWNRHKTQKTHLEEFSDALKELGFHVVGHLFRRKKHDTKDVSTERGGERERCEPPPLCDLDKKIIALLSWSPSLRRRSTARRNLCDLCARRSKRRTTRRVFH